MVIYFLEFNIAVQIDFPVPYTDEVAHTNNSGSDRRRAFPSHHVVYLIEYAVFPPKGIWHHIAYEVGGVLQTNPLVAFGLIFKQGQLRGGADWDQVTATDADASQRSGRLAGQYPQAAPFSPAWQGRYRDWPWWWSWSRRLFDCRSL